MAGRQRCLGPPCTYQGRVHFAKSRKVALEFHESTASRSNCLQSNNISNVDTSDMAKRPATLDSFFSPPPLKRQREDKLDATTTEETFSETSKHSTYPWPLPHLPASITDTLAFSPADEGRVMNDQPDLDLVYYQPYVPKDIARPLFEFLRRELFFYRVKYMIKRGPTETQINTPRFTTVFGLDETSRFDDNGGIVDAITKKPVAAKDYSTCKPRPIPECLDALRRLTEGATGCQFNFCLVNYYATGDDSISYHSDDERFLGPDPAIASFTLGAKRPDIRGWDEVCMCCSPWPLQVSW